MKKIVLLLALVLIFAACDNGSSPSYDYTQQTVFFTGTTTEGGNPFTITGSKDEIIYTTSSSSNSFMFSLTKSGEVTATMGKTDSVYTTDMWDTLSITTSANSEGYAIRNIAKSVGDSDGYYTFTMKGDYTAAMSALTNQTSIAVNFSGTEADKTYELSSKFSAAIKNYFQ